MSIFPFLQLTKNLLILPLIDSLSLSIRLTLTIFNPLTRASAYGLGTILIGFGFVWDNSIGLLFTGSAIGLTLICDAIDGVMGQMKQAILSYIEVQRANLYAWGFTKDTHASEIVNDLQYYTCDPRNWEKLPHTQSHCLLNSLDNPPRVNLCDKQAPYSVDYFPALFSSQAGVLAAETAPLTVMSHD